jgi:hypothetical protein
VLIDVGEQGLRFGVQHPEPGVLAPQLLGLFLDLLDFDRLRVHSQLVTGIASPIERRAQVARRIARTQ